MSTLQQTEQTSPSAPGANTQLIYPKVGGWAVQNSAGVEQLLVTNINYYCGTSGGSLNAQTLTPSPAVVSYAAAIGQEFLFIAGFTNNAAMTIAVSGLTGLNTTMGSIALPAGGVVVGERYWALIESATSIRIAPYDAASTDGDTLNGALTFVVGTTAIPAMIVPAGTLLTNAVAGGIEADAAANYATINTTNGRAYDDAFHYFRLASNGGAISGIADMFGSNDGIPTVLNGVYEIEWKCYGTVATGGTMTFTIVNTQTVTNMVADWEGNVITGIATTGAVSQAGVITQTAASVALPVTGLLSAASHIYTVRAVIEAGTAGNVRLRGTMSAGTWTPLRGSYFKVRRLPAGNAGTFVA
jgi:hypothetical protein